MNLGKLGPGCLSYDNAFISPVRSTPCRRHWFLPLAPPASHTFPPFNIDLDDKERSSLGRIYYCCKRLDSNSTWPYGAILQDGDGVKHD